jgi:serine protease AprX
MLSNGPKLAITLLSRYSKQVIDDDSGTPDERQETQMKCYEVRSNKSGFSGRVLTVVWVGLIGLGAAYGAHPKVSPELDGVSGETAVDVIVTFKQIPTFAQHAKILVRGGSVRRSLEVVRGGAYRISAAKLADLANDPDVEYISPDHAVHGTLQFAEPAINANIAFQHNYDGTGIGIAIIDSGIMTHPDTSNRIVYNENFVPNIGNDYFDRYGHGTHVAGIAAGDAVESNGPTYTHTFRGIAPNALLINLRVLDGNGNGQDSSVIAALQRAIQLKSSYNIRVINLSLGRPVTASYTVDPLCQAVEQAWKAGIVVVVAAGNDGRDNSANTSGYGTITVPGNDPYVITVGAMKDMGTVTRADDLIASYSSKGPTMIDHIVKPDIVAPGNQIISTIPAGLALTNSYPQNKVSDAYYMLSGNNQGSDYYFTLSGTSMATPMVSGTAALMLQKDSTLTPDTVKARLMKSATKTFPKSSTATDPTTGQVYTSYYDIFTVGAGYLDAWAALNNTDALPSSDTSQSPAAQYNSSTGQVQFVSGTNLVWGSTVVWGSNIVWGSTVVSGTNLVWGSNIVWGSSTLAGFTVVWGSNIVWGSGTPAGEISKIAIFGEK